MMFPLSVGNYGRREAKMRNLRFLLSFFAVVALYTVMVEGVSATENTGRVWGDNRPRPLPLMGEVISGRFFGCKEVENVQSVVANDTQEKTQTNLLWKWVDQSCLGISGRAQVEAYHGIVPGGDGIERCVVKLRIKVLPWMDQIFLYVSIPGKGFLFRARCRRGESRNGGGGSSPPLFIFKKEKCVRVNKKIIIDNFLPHNYHNYF